MTYRPTYRPTAAAAVTTAAYVAARCADDVACCAADAALRVGVLGGEHDPQAPTRHDVDRASALAADADRVARMLGAVRGDVVTYADAAVALADAALRYAYDACGDAAAYDDDDPRRDALRVVLAAAAYVRDVVAAAVADGIDDASALARRRCAAACDVLADAAEHAGVADVLADPLRALAAYAAG